MAISNQPSGGIGAITPGAPQMAPQPTMDPFAGRLMPGDMILRKA